MAISQVRVTSGIYKNRPLATPGDHTHPMSSRIRLAIFNSLGDVVRNANILDAFAGSGTLGIEALSRGAKSVTFLENNRAARQIIKNNLRSLNIPDQTITNQLAQDQTFDIIFADPPYDDTQDNLLTTLPAHLTPGGFFILSYPKSKPLPTFANLVQISHKTYAGASITMYQKH